MKENTYELTNSQKSIWLTEQFYKNTCINNICGTLIISDNIDLNKLKQTINIFVRDNDSFRIQLQFDSANKIVQYFSDFSNFDIEACCLSNNDDLLSLEKEMVNTPFSLIDSPLYKFKLFCLPNGHGGIICVMHHLIADACTTSILASKLMNIYDSLLKNNSISETPTSYKNYIEAEKSYLSSDKFKKDKEYWNDKFKTVPEVGIIPSNKQEIQNTSDASRKIFILKPSEVKKISDFCNTNKISLFNFFMAVYAIYINKISNLDDFVLGTPILNRTTFAEKNTTGMYISTVPFRFRIDNSAYFIDFAKQVTIDTLSMFRHQKYPYQNILEDIRKKNPSQPNLFDILISYQNAKTNKNSSQVPYEVRWTFNNNVADSMQIHLFDMNDEGKLNIAYDYKLSKYSEEDICALHLRISHIIEQILNTQKCTIQDIEIVTPNEKLLLLDKFNSTTLDYNENKTVVDYFEEQVEKCSNAVALVFENKVLTYKQLNEKVNSLARFLKQHNIGFNSIVGVMLNRSFEMIVSILAVLKAGAAYIPIDPEYPEERISYMLSQSKSSILVTQKHLENKIEKIKFSGNIIYSDFSNTEVYALDNSNLKAPISPKNLSYLIYTSGSTGQPKGVMLTHKNLSNFISSMINKIAYLNDSKPHSIVSITTVSFDIFCFETIVSLCRGLKLFITNEAEQKITVKLERLISDNKIEIIQSTPSIMNFHIENSTTNAFSNLNYVMLAGEQLPKQLVNKIKQISPNCTVYNGYGPSETTIFSTVKDVTNLDSITIGEPINNTQIYILNDKLSLLPPNTIGEIYIAGDGVGNGYLYRDDLTCERYLNNPFKENSIMYKTGDLGLWLSDGSIECKGRADHQVKLRGLRIELGEIEELLSQIPNISNCCVVKKTLNNRETLCAYYTTIGSVSVEDIRKLLQMRLPNYMVPQYFVKLDKLPHTPNGKVDRKLLPLPQLENEDKKIVLPRNKLDAELIELIKNLLNINEVSLLDNLFELGADSLTAINLSIKVLDKFNVQLYIKDILSSNTIKELSDFIQKNQNNTAHIQKIPKAKEQALYPLSSAQQRIYYASKMIGDNNIVYNTPGAILINEILDSKKVQVAFNTLMNRHSAFRTNFILKGDNVYQVIKNDVNFTVPVFHNTESQKDEIIKNFSKPFNLEKDCLLRVELHYLDSNKTLLLLDSHHIIMDGTSLNNLIFEFNQLYNGNTLEPLNLEYKDYSTWENELIESNEIKKYEEYWINKFKDFEIPTLDLPYNYHSATNNTFRGKKLSYKLDNDIFDNIEKYSKSIGISPYVFFISAFFILLYKYTGQEEIILGTPTANRDLKETKNMIGMFVNNLVVKSNINSSETFTELLNHMKLQILNDLSNQAFPYDLLVQKLYSEKNINNKQLFNVMFTYQNTENIPISFGNASSEIIEIDNNISKFDLSVEIKPNTRIVNIEYCIDLFNEHTINRLFDHYTNILKFVLANDTIQIKNISMISDKEKDIIINKFNNSKNYNINNNLVLEFENIVKRYNNEIAVIKSTDSITYKELDEKSNYLANKLLNDGLKNGDVVGVYLSKSIELVISIWAILKAGGVYMPMYIKYPKDRLEYMIENSNAKFLITKKEDLNNINFSKHVEIINSYKEIKELQLMPQHINISLDNVAYIIYTSGSTGKPKGVQITHKNLINFLYAFNEYYDNTINNNDNLLSSTNISFDVSIWELFLSILNGAKLVLYEEDVIQDIFKYTNSIINNNITTLYIPPNILNETYELLKNQPNVKINKMLVGVEPITKSTLNKYFELNPNIKIINGYGPTETTICCTALKYNFDDSNNDIVSIGQNLYGDRIYILDKDRNIQAIGIKGELYVSGQGIGKGYINNKLETDKNYIINTLDSTSSKIYKTGDIAKWEEDGTIKFVGRNDSQVKISGHRIELAEINQVIMDFPCIKKSHTITYKKGNKTYLLSYFISENKIDITELMNYMKLKLADFMIPNSITQLEDFPLTLNGKIDNKKLPINLIDVQNYVAPRNSFEEIVASIWMKLLAIEKIGIDDNFFEIGADSLIAIKFQIEAMNAGLSISYSDIFEYPTIRKLYDKDYKSNNYQVDYNYDYTKVDKLLSKNISKNINTSVKNTSEVKNILLLGSTGFLGSHILDNFLASNNGKVYCLIREKESKTIESRLKSSLHFYFDNKYDEILNQRIILVKGDISQEQFGMTTDEYNSLANDIDIIIDSAAIVKHYGSLSQFNSTNVEGTKNVIKFAKLHNKKLYYISTLSVSGRHSEDNNNHIFSETNFYLNQELDNIYIYTKFEAEKLIYDEIENGLSACILRIGNITNRYSDGKFQINASDNAFLNRIKSVIKLGKIQRKLLAHAIEFTPVDYCSNAIIKIVNSNPSFNMFHLFNHNFIGVDNLLQILDSFGISLTPVSDEEFRDEINKCLSDEHRRNDISGIINDLDKNKLLDIITAILPDSQFSIKYLNNLGFEWPKIDKEYISKYIKYLREINYL